MSEAWVEIKKLNVLLELWFKFKIDIATIDAKEEKLK